MDVDEKSENILASDSKIVVIGISGATRSGKGTLSKKLYKELGGKEHCVWLCQDPFFDHKVITELNGNWEDPRTINHDAYLAEAQKKMNKLKQMNEEKKTKYLILEGFVLFYDERIVKMMDYMLWLEIAKEVCYFRRMSTKRVGEEYFQKWLWPCYQKYRKSVFDNEEMAKKIMQIEGTLKSQIILQKVLKQIGVEYEICDEKDEHFDKQDNIQKKKQEEVRDCIVL